MSIIIEVDDSYQVDLDTITDHFGCGQADAVWRAVMLVAALAHDVHDGRLEVCGRDGVPHIVDMTNWYGRVPGGRRRAAT
jgi:hypothetical protein